MLLVQNLSSSCLQLIAWELGLRSLTVSAANLVCFVFEAQSATQPVDLQLPDVPVLSKVKLSGELCGSPFQISQEFKL